MLLKLFLMGFVLSTHTGTYAAAATNDTYSVTLISKKMPSLQALARAAICHEIQKIKNNLDIENFDTAMRIYLTDKKTGKNIDIPAELKERITKEFEEIESLIDKNHTGVTAVFHEYLNQVTKSRDESDEAFTTRYKITIESFIARHAKFYPHSYNKGTVVLWDNGAEALWIAAKRGYAEMTKDLLQYGAWINAASFYFYTSPLMVAAQAGYIDVIDVLLQAGADTGVVVKEGRNRGMTALACAASKGKTEVVTKLLKAGAHVEAEHYGPSAILTHALNFKNNLDVVRILIDAKANINAKNLDCHTALMCAVQHPHSQQAVKLLLEAGADKTLINSKGKTAADIAEQAENQAVLDLLRA